jgi:hypothetical protein
VRVCFAERSLARAEQLDGRSASVSHEVRTKAAQVNPKTSEP